jgi:hypothetical protein
MLFYLRILGLFRLKIVQRQVRGRLMNNKLETMREEAVVTQLLKVPTRHLPGGTEKTRDNVTNSVRKAGFRVEI